jgi:large subunit ribosomal protein L33
MAKKTKSSHMAMDSTEGSGYQYHTLRSGKPGGNRSRLELRKYDPVLRKHVVFRESKKSS